MQAAPKLIERGILWLGYGFAAALPGMFLMTPLQGMLVDTLAIPPHTHTGGEDGLFAVVLFWILILPDARPARAGQWLALVAISVLFFAVATLAWASAAALLFRLASQQEFGIAVAVLLGVTAAAAGWGAYRLFDRLAGRASPWWGGADAQEGTAG